MSNLNLLLTQIKNDDEALIIISILGFSMAEWSFIKNIGGPLHALNSDLFLGLIKKKIQDHPSLFKQWQTLRQDLDYFYDQKGFLCTPLNLNNKRLFSLAKAPLLFFGRFNPECLNQPVQVAVVGARDACLKGLKYSRDLASSLASHNINVISGGALGVDKQAHLGALKQGGRTCIVSGTVCNLRDEAKNLIIQNQDRMAIIYPFGPFSHQGKYMFVQRNKYVVALSDVLIVVQGREGSGTLHTVKFAEEQKIPIFAIPGDLDNPLSYVPNQLLQRGQARAIADFGQIDQALMTNKADALKKPKKAMPVLSEALPEILMLIKNRGNSLSMAEILAISGRSFLSVQKEMLEFELSGRVIKQGSQFVLTGR